MSAASPTSLAFREATPRPKPCFMWKNWAHHVLRGWSRLGIQRVGLWLELFLLFLRSIVLRSVCLFDIIISETSIYVWCVLDIILQLQTAFFWLFRPSWASSVQCSTVNILMSPTSSCYVCLGISCLFIPQESAVAQVWVSNT